MVFQMMKMKSSRWLKISLPISIESLGMKMLDVQFRAGETHGFILSKRNKRTIQGKYVQEKLIVKEIEDPFGKKVTYERVDYSVTKFELTGRQGISLEIEDPPRSLKPFIRAVSDLAGLGFSAINIQMNLMECIETLSIKLDKLNIRAIDCSQVNVDNQSNAKIRLEGEGDVKKSLNKFVGNRYRKVDRVNCLVEHEGYSGELELRATGVICYKGLPRRIIASILKDVITEVTNL